MKDERNKAVQVPGVKLETSKQANLPSEQSANVLFKFVDKLNYLLDILKDGAIMPRYNQEEIDYLKLGKHKSIAFPMICFCDIHLNRLLPHMKFYGSYGIGLNKTWGISKGIQPVHYVNPSSELIADYKYIFSKSLEMENSELSGIKEYNNYLLAYLLFTKPLNGNMYRNGEVLIRNFHDEKEWRYIPNIADAKTELPLIIPSEQMNPKAYKMYSSGISQCEELWLKYEYEDIKYIVVRNDKDRNNIIRFIMDKLKIAKEERLSLVSKILVFNSLEEDW